MKPFQVFQPTEIRFGRGRFRQLGKAAATYGQRALLVTVPPTDDLLAPAIAKAKALLESAGLTVAHFDGVVPHPTTDSITAGAALARGHRADVIVGLGGGSSMDTAKAIAVEATHEGTCWDYRLFKAEPTPRTLPVIAVTTTSGTGSHVTQVAVATNAQQRDKSYLCHPLLFPKVAVVDPELMLTLPRQVTALTGWDAFTHAFEALLHKNCSPYVGLLAAQSMRLVAANLLPLLEDLGNLERRSALAWADTLAGLCLANAGVTLPHSIGMAISGRWPHVAHGESLALIYPAFTRFTQDAAIPQFAAAGRAINPELIGVTDEDAAAQCCVEIDMLLQQIGLWYGLDFRGVPAAEFDALAAQSLTLPDYRNNPRVATKDEIRAMLDACRVRS
jgi:alcohol dehydrogenase class IV